MQFIYILLCEKNITSVQNCDPKKGEVMFYRQDIILEIFLHACELSSQASILKVLTLQPEIAKIK